MNSFYRVNDHIKDRESVFLNIKRIDDFFTKNFPNFNSNLKSHNIESESDYFDFVSDPALEMSEQGRVQSQINMLRKLKSFSKEYDVTDSIKKAQTIMELQELITEREFIQDTGTEVFLDMTSESAGQIYVVLHAVQGEPKSIKLPFSVQWNFPTGDEYDVDNPDVQVGSICLLGGKERFPKMFSALNEIKFTNVDNIGLKVDAGLSLNDLKDRSILMKMGALDYNETSELLAFGRINVLRGKEPFRSLEMNAL